MLREEKTREQLANVKIHDNGAAFCIMVDGFFAFMRKIR